MNRKSWIAGGAIAAVVVAGVAVGASVAWADAESEVRGVCGDNVAYELSVEDDNGGTELAFELQSTAPDETWAVLVQQGDQTLLEGERRTDSDAELDLDVLTTNDGVDAFTVTATPAAGEPCVATLTR